MKGGSADIDDGTKSLDKILDDVIKNNIDLLLSIREKYITVLHLCKTIDEKNLSYDENKILLDEVKNIFTLPTFQVLKDDGWVEEIEGEIKYMPKNEINLLIEKEISENTKLTNNYNELFEKFKKTRKKKEMNTKDSLTIEYLLRHIKENVSIYSTIINYLFRWVGTKRN